MCLFIKQELEGWAVFWVCQVLESCVYIFQLLREGCLLKSCDYVCLSRFIVNYLNNVFGFFWWGVVCVLFFLRVEDKGGIRYFYCSFVLVFMAVDGLVQFLVGLFSRFFFLYLVFSLDDSGGFSLLRKQFLFKLKRDFITRLSVFYEVVSVCLWVVVREFVNEGQLQRRRKLFCWVIDVLIFGF